MSAPPRHRPETRLEDRTKDRIEDRPKRAPKDPLKDRPKDRPEDRPEDRLGDRPETKLKHRPGKRPGNRPSPRDAIVRAAATLFRRRGFAATGINEIVAQSGAPKGSLYHYFPHGKDQIAEAALRFAGQGTVATLDQLARKTASGAALVRAYCRLVAGWMAKSEFRDGSPIATVLLEAAPDSREISAAGREVFAGLRDTIAGRLVADGFGRAEARRRALMAVAAIEGALILARTERSAAPIEDVGRALAAALRPPVSAAR
ncbi:MAG: TetR family transcriptional regulator [Xanthobacteraceae bacterium]|nr:TetR family transcriptional regulator [Xanthobacteraceae bacterium]